MSDYKKARAYIKLKRFCLYAIRWQLSTPILAIVMWMLQDKMGYIGSTIIANFIGACIFYWVDKFIFLKNRHSSE